MKNSKRRASRPSETDLAERILQVAAHEIRGPLSALQLQLSLIERDPEGSIRMGLLLKAQEQVVLATKFLGRLLAIRESPNCRLELQLEAVDFGSLVGRSCELIREWVDSRGCRLTLEIDDGAMITCDVMRVRQLLFNLIENAVKYSGGGEIKVRFERAQENAPARLTVADSGPGIPDDLQMRIFRKYSRAENSRLIGGLGLGLHLCQRIVRAHSWRISAANGECGGVVITVMLEGAGPLSAM